MMLVVRSDLIELILQRPHSGDAVDELQMAPLLVILAA
jgi:hypothetical protein